MVGAFLPGARPLPTGHPAALQGHRADIRQCTQYRMDRNPHAAQDNRTTRQRIAGQCRTRASERVQEDSKGEGGKACIWCR